MGIGELLARLALAGALFAIFWGLSRLDPPRPPDDEEDGW